MNKSLTHPKYRADIDGLRAVAVLLVIGFHAFPSLIRGGFIGVDIFFVISGFLISTIIFSNLESNSFSFIEFYSHRIRRIFPALLLVLITSFTLGWFVLFADEYKQLSKHIAGSAVFISNFLFWKESGYFENSAETKPLLHLWSLGIEEQFYIIWPLVLWFFWKKRFNLLTIVIVVTIVSFMIGLSKVRDDKVAAFYLPQMRFWELLIGSVLAYIMLYKQNTFLKFRNNLDIWLYQIIYAKASESNEKILHNIQSLLGIILITIGVLIITKEGRFPGKLALFPTIGTALIISAGAKAWLNRLILSNRLLVWFGLISFPLYLWHWSLLSFANIIKSGVLSFEIKIVIIMISILLAWLTYKLIEKPIRFGGRRKIKLIILIMLMNIVGFIGFSCYWLEGLPLRSYPLKYQTYTQSMVRTPREIECFEVPYVHSKKDNWFCNLGNKDIKPKFFAYGDSHALSLLPALEKYSIENKTNIIFTGISSCPPLLEIQSLTGEERIKQGNCKELNERIFNFVRDNKISSVLLIGRWSIYTGGGTIKPDDVGFISSNNTREITKESSKIAFEYALKQTIEKYRNIGVRVYLFEDNPQQIHEPKEALRQSNSTDDSINRLSVSIEEHKNNQSWVSNKFMDLDKKMVTIINFDNVLCNSSICQLSHGGKMLYFDDDHLSVYGSMFVYQNLQQALLNKNE